MWHHTSKENQVSRNRSKDDRDVEISMWGLLNIMSEQMKNLRKEMELQKKNWVEILDLKTIYIKKKTFWRD